MTDNTDTSSVMGRPRMSLNWEEIAGMCEIHCTKKEICNVLKISEDTLDRHCREEHGVTFRVFYSWHADIGKKSLRRKQWDVALKEGNVTMLRWLGINELGQSDKQETTATVHVSGFEVIPETDSQE